MNVKALMNFTDYKEKKERVKDEIFTVTNERLQELNGKYDFPLVEVVTENKEPKKTQRVKKIKG